MVSQPGELDWNSSRRYPYLEDSRRCAAPAIYDNRRWQVETWVRIYFVRPVVYLDASNLT